MAVNEAEESPSNIGFNVLTKWKVEPSIVSFPSSFPLRCCGMRWAVGGNLELQWLRLKVFS